MIKRDELIKTIEGTIGNDLVKRARIFDPYANGVQVQGKEEVAKVALGVSVNVNFLNEAIDAGAQFCIFHHGLDLTTHNIVSSRMHPGLQKRLKLVFDHDLTVAGYHASLDIQPEFGNSATIIDLLGAKRLDIPYFDGWGWVGEFEKPIAVEKIAEQLSEIMSHDIFAVYGGKDKVKRIGVSTGASKPYSKEIWEILDLEIDAHISGEIIEPGPAQAMDIEYNYFSCGHYATEVFGVQELGKKLKSKYKDKLEFEFIDIPNPL